MRFTQTNRTVRGGLTPLVNKYGKQTFVPYHITVYLNE